MGGGNEINGVKKKRERGVRRHEEERRSPRVTNRGDKRAPPPGLSPLLPPDCCDNFSFSSLRTRAVYVIHPRASESSWLQQLARAPKRSRFTATVSSFHR